ncbi:MAG: hypothetical protein HY330_03775 [Chloroflexi bacterium]|nr:hypothetical protein [Chloroflexota bacterium]
MAKQIKRYEFPDRKLVNRSYTHDLEELLDVSGLKVQHKQEVQDNPAFAVNWATVKDWSEEARYTTLVTEEKARDFFAAVTARRYGVLRWLKKLW